MTDMKDYNLTCGEVLDNLLTLADAYEKASAGKAPNGFAFNPTDAAANMKAAVHFIGSFGQQMPVWIPVEERLPEDGDWVLWFNKSWGCPVVVAKRDNDSLDWGGDFCHTLHGFTHWMTLPPEPPNCVTQPR